MASVAKRFGDVTHFHQYALPSALKAKSKKKPLFVNDQSTPNQLPNVPVSLAPGVGCMIPPRFDPASMQNCRSVEFDMTDYCRSAVKQYKDLAGVDKLKHAPSPFLPDGSLTEADASVRGQMAGSA